jgi:hypothetical protein
LWPLVYWAPRRTSNPCSPCNRSPLTTGSLVVQWIWWKEQRGRKGRRRAAHDVDEECDTGERHERCRTMWTSGASGSDSGFNHYRSSSFVCGFNIALKVIFFESVTVPQYLI